MNEVECAWVAGLLEGEGSFAFVGRRDKLRTFPQINCSMTDEDVIRKLHRLVGVGYVHEDPGNKRQNPNYKMMWRWSVARRDDVITVLTCIRPHLGERRGTRVDELLQHFDDHPPMRSLIAPCGTHRKYAKGCRCDVCKAGESTYRTNLKARRDDVQAA